MDNKELKEIIDLYGGVKPLGEAMGGVSHRTIEGWLYSGFNIPKAVVTLLKILKEAKLNESNIDD